jgi:hypothetical protein
MSDMSFELGDVVEYREKLYKVSGVIHDSERLFLENGWSELEIKFSEVECHYVPKGE